MAFVKPIKEEGIIISKVYTEARAERTDLNGKIWPATQEKFEIEVISCDEDNFNKDTGILNGTRCKYPVSKEIYQKAKFGMWAKVKFEASQYNAGDVKIKPLSFAFMDKN